MTESPQGRSASFPSVVLIRPSARSGFFVGRRNVHGDSGESGEASPDSEKHPEAFEASVDHERGEKASEEQSTSQAEGGGHAPGGFCPAWRISRHTHVTMTSKAGGPSPARKQTASDHVGGGVGGLLAVPWAEISVMRPRHRVPVTCPPSSTLRSTGPLEEKYVSCPCRPRREDRTVVLVSGVRQVDVGDSEPCCQMQSAGDSGAAEQGCAVIGVEPCCRRGSPLERVRQRSLSRRWRTAGR